VTRVTASISGSLAAAPLSYAQRRLWIVNALQSKSPADNIRTAYRLRGSLDTSALHASLRAIAQRHEILRTTFELVDGVPMQVIARAFDPHTQLCDLSTVPAGQRDADADGLLRDFADVPFDLAAGPLMRTLLLRIAPDEHVLQIVVHQSVFDRGSVEPFNRDLSALYAGFRNGAAAKLGELLIQYADFAAWQRDALDESALLRELTYWRQALAGAPPRIDLPADLRRHAGRRRPGATRSIVLPSDLTRRIAALGRSSGTTLFVTLLAAFNAVLYRYTGQRDLVVGIPVANRRRTELEPLIGCFANTLPLRTQLHGAMSFDELLRRTRETALTAFEHQDLPFERLVAELQPERDTDDTPLLNVAFFEHTEAAAALQFDGITSEHYPIAGTSAKFDLSFCYAAEPHGLTCSAQYDASLFEPATIERFLHHFAQLIEALVEEPGAPIGRLPMLAPDELDQLLVRWNPEPRALGADPPLRARFEANAALTPDAVAVVCSQTALSYGELNARANQLARALLARGVRRDEIIAIALPRSTATVMSMLAILKAGGAYLPLDLEYPLERLRFMLADSGARIVLTEHAGAERVRSLGTATDYLELDSLDLSEYPADDVPTASAADDLAYVMYTSGSTGRPKGVLVTQRAVENLVTDTATIAVHPADAIAQIASISFDASTFEIWAALLNGARVEIVPREVVLAPDALAEYLRERGVTIALVTSALLGHISRHAPAAFAPLRYLLTGGDVLDPAAVREIFAHGPPRLLLNAYGPTEATGFSTTFAVTQPAGTGIPIGRPIANTQAYILDPDGNVAPIGVRGQLHLGGWGLARGYHNDPELTQRKFIPHPFSSAPNARLYATGDIGYYRADGTIAFLGRSDHQVKIRGFRIEIGEIEAALKALAGVRDAVVTVASDPAGEKRIVAYAVDDARPARDPAQWRETLALRLPRYLLPDTVISVPVIPMTDNGKVDIRALADAHRAHFAVRAVEPPQSPTERAVAETIAGVLGLERVGRHDDFFALGGHSLLASRVISRLGDRFDVNVSLREFFAGPNAAELARRIGCAPRRAAPVLHPQYDPHLAELSDAQIDALLEETLRG
jgi:amino acid adenylation domain-containing protein